MQALKLFLSCALLSLIATFFYSLGSLKSELISMTNQKATLQKEIEALSSQPLRPPIPPSSPKPTVHSSALGYINTYYPEDHFVSIDLLPDAKIQPHTRLLITRDNQAIGQVMVSTIEKLTAVADTLDYTFEQSPIHILPKDTLVIPPSQETN